MAFCAQHGDLSERRAFVRRHKLRALFMSSIIMHYTECVMATFSVNVVVGILPGKIEVADRGRLDRYRLDADSAFAPPDLVSTRTIDDMLVEELSHCSTEHRVVIAGDHMAGFFDVDVPGVGAQCEKLANTFFGHDIGAATTHKHGGQIQMLRG